MTVYRLEVFELDKDTADTQWNTWCTYTDESKARQRRDKLIAKGYTARVAGGDTRLCTHCGTTHVAPHDGSCLL